MKSIRPTITFLLGIFLFQGCSSQKKDQFYTSDEAPTPEQVVRMVNEGETYTSGWPDYSKRVAQAQIKKYGHPTESTPQMLIWRGIAPFKRITVYREQVPHNFPIPHLDVVEHVVDYRVPSSKADDLTIFDGSVTFNRTRGELSSCSDLEAMNYLALNLAHEVITGKRSVLEARTEYGRSAINFLNGQRSAYLNNLMFPRSNNPGFKDQSIKIIWTPAQAQEIPPTGHKGDSKQLNKNRKEILDKAQLMEMTE